MSLTPDGLDSSVIFPVYGNVYPDGLGVCFLNFIWNRRRLLSAFGLTREPHLISALFLFGLYYVSINIGDPPKPYFLDVDTGSDLTWVQCDAPCLHCSKGPHPLYRPVRNKLVFCKDPLCYSIRTLTTYRCEKPQDQCDYEIEYADQGSSVGVLVRDTFSLRMENGSLLQPSLAFGCGYDQHIPDATSTSKTDGVLGLGNGESSILSQLRDLGVLRNVIGHCFSGRGRGYLFFGNSILPRSGVTWTPMSRNPLHKHYSPGPTNIIFGEHPMGVKDIQVIFDSGSSFSYFASQPYQALLSMLRKALSGKPLKEAPEDNTLPLCWKGSRRFKSVVDVKKYFKSLVLIFGDGKKAVLEIPPEGYLIISKHGNVCLGILNGSEIGLRDLNIIGDISFQDFMVIYDNEKQQIGWIRANCDRIPKSGIVLILTVREWESREMSIPAPRHNICGLSSWRSNRALLPSMGREMREKWRDCSRSLDSTQRSPPPPLPSLWISQLTHLSLSLFGSPSLSRSRSRSDDPSLSVSLWFTLHLLLAVEKSPSLLIYLKISPPFEKDHPQKALSRGPSSRPFLHRSRPKPPTAAIHASSSLCQEETKSPLFIETIGGSVELKLLSSVAFLAIVASKWVVLVRHGQSTWNEEGWIQGSSEEGRIQGSSDYVVVTNKGEAQAETSRQMLLTNTFHSEQSYMTMKEDIRGLKETRPMRDLETRVMSSNAAYEYLWKQMWEVSVRSIWRDVSAWAPPLCVSTA
ncbi:hypothetical protein ACLOJK_016856 [Asimina triloba]